MPVGANHYIRIIGKKGVKGKLFVDVGRFMPLSCKENLRKVPPLFQKSWGIT
jgi:hypothetical protein